MKIILDYILQFVALDKAEIDLFTSYLTAKNSNPTKLFSKKAVFVTLYFCGIWGCKILFLK